MGYINRYIPTRLLSGFSRIYWPQTRRYVHIFLVTHLDELVFTISSSNLIYSWMLACCVDDSMLILRNDYAGSSFGFFYRPWTEYQQGFGSPTALYWIGLDRLHQLTQGNCQVRFDLQATNGTWHYAQYSSFSVDNSSTSYVLTIGGYSGETGHDAMALSNGQQFSAYDQMSQGGLCPRLYGGGFWYEDSCGEALITTSTANRLFRWTTSNGWMNLNVVQVSLLC